MKKKHVLYCDRCEAPIEDIGLAMLYWQTDPVDHGVVIAWKVTHKDLTGSPWFWDVCCDRDDYNLSAELNWILGPDGMVSRKGREVLYRILMDYGFTDTDRLAICALFRVPPPSEFERTGRKPEARAWRYGVCCSPLGRPPPAPDPRLRLVEP